MRRTSLVIAILTALAGTTTSLGQDAVRPVALESDAAPGTGGLFTNLGDSGGLPVINNDGDIAFIAFAAGGMQGIWFEDAGSLIVMRLEGDVAAGTGGLDEFSRFEDLIITRSNSVAFTGETIVSSTMASSEKGYWEHVSGTTNLLIRGGEAAPYLASDATLLSFSGGWFMSYNPSGVAVVRTRCDRPSPFDPQGNAIITGVAGNWSKIALNGELIPFSSYEWTRFSNNPYITPNGTSMFEYDSEDLMSTPTSIIGVYFGGPSFVEEFTLVPGGGLNDEHGNFNENSIVGCNGLVAVAGDVNDPISGITDFDSALWRMGTMGELVASQGMSAPGTPMEPFKTFSTGGLSVAMNANGDMAFRHGTTSTDGIWAKPLGGTLSAIALEGQAAPGLSGFTFASDTIGPPMIVNQGQIAFKASADGPGGAFATGIWATDSTGNLQLVISTNDTVDPDGDCSTLNDESITAINLDDGPGTPQGQSNAFNDEGEMVLQIRYGSGDWGIFVVDTRFCRADFNGDGALTIDDFLAFQNAFTNMEPAADWDCDGSWTIFDFNAFNSAFSTGCDWY